MKLDKDYCIRINTRATAYVGNKFIGILLAVVRVCDIAFDRYCLRAHSSPTRCTLYRYSALYSSIERYLQYIRTNGTFLQYIIELSNNLIILL